MPRLSKIGAAALAAFGWTGISAVSASYLVVAGGAGGGFDRAGGGGAGGYRTGTESLNPTLSYTITVGAGGSGSSAGANKGSNGSDSVFSTITSTGGGGGGSGANAPGANGGSGGGGRDTPAGTGGSGNTPSTSPSQGNNGGSLGSSSGSIGTGGGGGGAGAVGSAGETIGTGIGGAGSASSISGSSVTYAGGGGGGGGTTAGGSAGGTGGGGAGGNANSAGTAGTANLGGGGGGGGDTSGNGGSGGSGIVIISYLGAQQFSGGVVTSVGGNTIHTFTTSGTLGPITTLSASYLIVAGGGGGSVGGGGAGGLLSGSGVTIDPNSTYLVTVGASGAGATTDGQGTSGSNSTFSMVSTAVVGGGGAGGYSNTAGLRVGLSGGSGGGGGARSGVGSGAGGTATSGQGNIGGNGFDNGAGGSPGGGGGGAGAAGGNGATVSIGGNGGIGLVSSISGTSTYYAGGGGGSANVTQGTGGSGGGGAGVASGTSNSGTANTGGGGGGNQDIPTVSGGNGGSGVVIISYAGATQLMAGGTVTIVGGNVIHTFTSTGFLAPIEFVNNSLRFRSSASAYLNRTLGTATNSYKWTWSAWVKRGTLGVDACLFSGGTTAGDANTFNIRFSSTDVITMSSDGTNWRITSQVFRDPAAWYHLVLAVDTTQATAANRILFYINGVQVTSFSTSNNPTQNTTIGVNTASSHYIANRTYPSNLFLDGYLTEVNFIDGQALTPSSFGTINSYGVWQPITYGGSYGTNGFYLPFTNTTSTTALGYDFSPQGNNWTTNNISLTAGATYDSMTDVPTLTSATAANYATFNPIDNVGGATFSNGNLQIVTTNAGIFGGRATIAVSSGKFYWEMTPTNNVSGAECAIGIDSVITPITSSSTGLGYSATSYSMRNSGQKVNNSTASAYGSSYTDNDVIGVALDMDAGTLTFYKNNTSQGTAFTGITGTFTPAMSDLGGAQALTLVTNFGQRPFAYTPPSGFVALNTFNL